MKLNINWIYLHIFNSFNRHLLIQINSHVRIQEIRNTMFQWKKSEKSSFTSSRLWYGNRRTRISVIYVIYKNNMERFFKLPIIIRLFAVGSITLFVANYEITRNKSWFVMYRMPWSVSYSMKKSYYFIYVVYLPRFLWISLLHTVR